MRDNDTVLLQEAYDLVMEMPHIMVGNKTFDLELEFYKNDLEGLIERLNNVFKGIEVGSNKEGMSHTFKFDNSQEAQRYWNLLKRDNFFNMFYNRFFAPTMSLAEFESKLNISA
jgi:hypothetical protein